MQIVIEIDEARYKDIQRIAEVQLESNHFQTAEQIIAKGVPLSKGHGRLIDADAMFKDICNSIEEMTNIGIAVDGQYLWEKLNDALFNMPTIIEADKERSDEE